MASIPREQVDILINMIIDSLDEESARETLNNINNSEADDNPLIADVVQRINEKFHITSDEWNTWADVPEEYTEDVEFVVLERLMSEENWKPKYANKLMWVLLHSNNPIPDAALKRYLTKLADAASVIRDNDMVNDLIERFISKDCHDILYRFADEDTKLVYRAYLDWSVGNVLPADNMYSAFVKSFHNHVLWGMVSFQTFFTRVCEKQVELKDRIKSYVQENKENSFLPAYVTNL